jgi:hypothetical protein
MNPVLGPVVATSPERRLSYLSGCGNGIFYWSGKAGLYDDIPRSPPTKIKITNIVLMVICGKAAL